MPTPRPVSKRLREMLGTEAAETMIDWLDALEEHQDEGRRELRGEIGQLRAEMGGLRAEMGELRAELRGQLRTGTRELRQEIGELRGEMRAGFARLETKIAQGDADLVKWMIGFWLASFGGMIGAIVALGRVVR